MTTWAENENGVTVALTGDEKEVRAESEKQLREIGFDAGLYPWQDLPLGPRQVVLARKMWHRSMAIVCFFEDLEAGQRYRVSVFRNRKTEEYLAGDLDLSYVSLGTPLTIEVAQNRTGTFRLQKADRR